MIRKLAAVSCLLIYFLGQAWAAAPAAPTLPLDTILLDLEDAPLSTVKKVAELQAQQQYQMDKGPLYKSCPKAQNSDPKKLSDEVFFEGAIVVASGKTQLALFSDDGCDVWINGDLVLNNFAKGQHLPDLKQSLHVLKYKFVANQTYTVKIHYANTIYLGKTDIDGCTLFAFQGGAGMAPSIQLKIDSTGVDPNPVCIGRRTAAGFRICLFVPGDKNDKLPAPNDKVKQQQYTITIPGGDKATVHSVTVDGITVEAKDFGKEKAAGFRVDSRTDPKTKDALIVLTKGESNPAPCITVFLDIAYAQVGKKTVTVEGEVKLQKVDKAQKDPLLDKSAATIEVLAAPAVEVQVDPVRPFGKDRPAPIAPASPINILSNPAAIVILKEKPTAADKANQLDLVEGNTATIEITKVMPADAKLNNQVDWSIENVEMFGGKTDGSKETRALFFANKQTTITAGKSVSVYGVEQGRIRIKAVPKANPQCFETFEAVVVEQRNVLFRAQLLSAKNGAGTTRTPDNVVEHVAIANRFHRQVGIRLVPDTNPAKDGAQQGKNAKGEIVPGVFTNVVEEKQVSVATVAALADALSLNSYPPDPKAAYPGALQVLYIGSFEKGATLGQAIARPGNPLTVKVESATTVAYRLTVSNPSVEHSIQFLFSSAFESGRPNPQGLFGLALANRGVQPLDYGRRLAHELGHVFTLRHRGPRDTPLNMGVDSVGGEIEKNLMYGADAEDAIAQDLDLGQLIIMRNSRIMPVDKVFSRP